MSALKTKEITVNGIRLLKVSGSALLCYKNSTKGCQHLDVITVRKKLTRNTLLGLRVSEYENSQGKMVKKFLYGKLEITVVGQTIVYVQQMKEISQEFKLYKSKYDYYNNLLGLKGK